MKYNLYYFLFFYVFIYMGNAVYGTFIPIYFLDVGFTQTQIGTLLSLGPLVAILAQPIWGSLSDRSKTKNRILKIMIGGCGLVALLYPISDNFSYLLIMICVFTMFQASVFALTDTITLEVLDRQRSGSYGMIRLGGTIGFAIMSIVFGIIAKNHIGSLFWVYSVIMLISFLLILRFPVIEGHQSQGRKMRIWVLLKNRKLMMYLAINFVLQITLGYYYAFFPIYFREMGGDNVLLGWSMVVSSLSEIPFLLLSGKIFKRVKISYILLGAAFATTVRWYLFSSIENPYWVLPVQLLHGLIFIVLSVTMATIINKEVPMELKASGQTFNGLLSLGVARIIGSFFGGIASAHIGMHKVFLYNSIVSLVCLAVFAVFFRLQSERKQPRAATL
jgi:PPP family 3-phenylpropionic acid transporter